MRKIKWTIDPGFAGCTRTGTFEVEDDATEEEIDEYLEDILHEYIHSRWEEDEE